MGRAHRGPLSSPPCPRSPFCHCQRLSLLSPPPSARLGCRSFQPPGGLGNPRSCVSRKRTLHFSLLHLGDSSEDRRARWLSQPRGICGSGSGPAVDILPGCDGGDSPLPFLPPPSPELWPYCYVFEAGTAGVPFMSGVHTSALCSRLWSRQQHLHCAKLGPTSAAGRRGKAARPVPTNHAAVFM